MAQYRDINELLLNTNKGPAGIGSSRYQAPGLPDPGDRVTVSLVDRGFLNILIHHIDPQNFHCRGETINHIVDSEANVIVARAERVTFSYKKIAGINRQ
jgi:hypothetical protein